MSYIPNPATGGVDGPEPTVSVRKVKEAVRWGWVPRLFIEEVEKLGNLTKDRAKHLWEVIAAVYDNNGQLVVTSNQSRQQFELEFGPDIYRRMANDGQGKIMDFFEYSKKLAVKTVEATKSDEK